MKNVLARIDPDEVVTLTRDLVRIPSVIRPGDPSATEAAMADHVHRLGAGATRAETTG